MIRSATIVTFALLLLSVSVADAAPQTATGAVSQASSATVTIGDPDNGKDIDLTAGGTLIVKLPSNPSTGYSWAVLGDPSPLKLEKTAYHKSSKSHAVGASGTQVLQFSASSAGIGNLTVAYRRSWEYNVPPVKTFSVRVNIR